MYLVSVDLREAAFFKVALLGRETALCVAVISPIEKTQCTNQQYPINPQSREVELIDTRVFE